MEKGSIEIKIEAGKAPSVHATLLKNNLWLTVNEMARLLGCFVQTVNANLRSIFKENLLSKKDCMRTNRYTDNGIEKQTEYYNLETLIFLSYRIHSFEAKVFREFVTSALREQLQKRKMPDAKIIWACLPKQNRYWLN
ncbi:MAG: hypothetical protein LBR64_00575 [Dysgonamonadaceae bacterium]|jgi:hypothetical protein|nr:hypothetical protein [Dysgonamonadaceae bacterium]